MKDKFQRLVRQVVCFLIGHRPALNGQQYETVPIHGIDGKTRQELRLVEREWCGRCRKLLSVDLSNAGHQRPAESGTLNGLVGNFGGAK